MTLLAPDAPTTLHSGQVDASPPSRGPDRPPARAGVAQVLQALSLLLVWGLLYLFVLSGLEQGQAQSGLYGELRTQLAEGTAPVGAPILPGAPVALLSIPTAGVEDVVVVEGSRPVQLQDAPGHVLGSVLPGQRGISVLAGRSLSFGAPFADIAELPLGAPIVTTTAQGRFVYEVSSIRRTGDPVPEPPSTDGGRLTLVTALRGDGLGLRAGETVYVDAQLAGKAADPGPVATADLTSKPMSATADTATLALLVLSMQLLVLVLVACAWSWRRWSPAATWLAGAPCVVASLWLVSSLGSRLLPALV